MKYKKHKIRVCVLFAIIFVLIGIGFLVVQSLVQSSSSKLLYVHEIKGAESYSKDDFYVDMSVSKSWGQDDTVGAQYDGVFHNNSDYDIKNWEIEITVPDKSNIDSSWNGVYAQKGDTILVSSMNYNATIVKKTSQTFGFVMYTPSKFDVENIIIRAYKAYNKEDFILYWLLLVALLVTVIAVIIYTIVAFREHRFKVKQIEYKKIILQSLNTFANFIDAKDPYTKGHSARVADYACEIARRMGMSEDEQDNISYIALLHDVGKIGITNELLYKPGKLTGEEMRVIQMHTTIGAEILKDFTALPGVADGAKYHHEWYDGKGYPNGLNGKNIPHCARIICIADSYDAMSSDRCYRKKLSEDQILNEFKKCVGTQFDPDIVSYIVEMIRDGFVKGVQLKEAYAISA
jgi:putative nucleotidyltransferase with HDIG domain